MALGGPGVESVVDDAPDGLIGKGEGGSRAEGILLEARESASDESVPPENAGVALGAELLSNLLIGLAFGGP